MRVWIQRGHCFRTSGSTGTTGEQDYVDAVADRAARLLVDRGHRVHVALADTYPVGDWDLFIALHCDGSTSPTASGASVGYRTDAGQRVARLWKARFAARGWPYGFRDDNYTPALAGYYGTGWARAEGIDRAFILEHGFLTNPDRDRAWLRSDEGREAAALALADVVAIEADDEPIEEDDMPLTDAEKADIAKQTVNGLKAWLRDGDDKDADVTRNHFANNMFDKLANPDDPKAKRVIERIVEAVHELSHHEPEPEPVEPT